MNFLKKNHEHQKSNIYAVSKKYLTVLLVIFFALNLTAQEDPKLVFDVTSSNVKTHQSTMRHVSSMAKSFPDSQFEVVVYSGSLEMVLSEKSTVAEAILKFSENNNVTFKVCATTMKRGGADKSMLIKGVDVVPNPLVQIYSRQKEGWGYIKETNN
ncbi:MAG: DsrE family protein [Flavobacteriaceae bacterium]|nr:DsrE family protein [Flavobacteriaceae bacterium]